jgi:hypothetical protein
MCEETKKNYYKFYWFLECVANLHFYFIITIMVFWEEAL